MEGEVGIVGTRADWTWCACPCCSVPRVEILKRKLTEQLEKASAALVAQKRQVQLLKQSHETNLHALREAKQNLKNSVDVLLEARRQVNADKLLALRAQYAQLKELKERLERERGQVAQEKSPSGEA